MSRSNSNQDPNKEKENTLTFGIVGCMAGVMLLCWGMFNWIQVYLYQEVGVDAQAVVIEKGGNPRPQGEEKYSQRYLKYSYSVMVNQEPQTYTHTEHIDDNLYHQVQVGDLVSIRLLSTNPEMSKLREHALDRNYKVILPIGLVVMMAGIFFIGYSQTMAPRVFFRPYQQPLTIDLYSHEEIKRKNEAQAKAKRHGHTDANDYFLPD